jgi:hypothetical protein
LDGPGDGGLFITSGLSCRSFGFILRNVETGELRYYHSSQNNSRFFDVPHLIRTEEDLERFLEELSRHDMLEYRRCHIMQGKIIPVLDTIAGRLLCTDGIPVS